MPTPEQEERRRASDEAGRLGPGARVSFVWESADVRVPWKCATGLGGEGMEMN